MGRRWKDISEEAKRQYTEMAEADKGAAAAHNQSVSEHEERRRKEMLEQLTREKTRKRGRKPKIWEQLNTQGQVPQGAAWLDLLKAELKQRKGPKYKRAKTGYYFFCRARRDDMKREWPSLNFGQINSKLGAAWKLCSEQEKSEFHAQAEETKEQAKRKDTNEVRDVAL